MNIGVDIGGTNMRAGIELGGSITSQSNVLLENKESLSSTLTQLMDLIRPYTKYPLKELVLVYLLW